MTPEEIYYDEYAPAAATDRLHHAPVTQRISVALATVERSSLSLVAIGLALAFACFYVGWQMRGLWGPIYDNRGWAALVVFSIVGSVFMVNYSNRRD